MSMSRASWSCSCRKFLRTSYTWLSRVRSEDTISIGHLNQTGQLTAAPKPSHRALPRLASRSPLEALSILFFAMMNKAREIAQAIHATREAKIAKINAKTSMKRLLQHHAKKAKTSVRRAKPAAVGLGSATMWRTNCRLTDRLEDKQVRQGFHDTSTQTAQIKAQHFTVREKVGIQCIS
jgi:hypothetical protein